MMWFVSFGTSLGEVIGSTIVEHDCHMAALHRAIELIGVDPNSNSTCHMAVVPLEKEPKLRFHLNEVRRSAAEVAKMLKEAGVFQKGNDDG